MAVNIPQIKRNNPVAQESIGRVQVDTGAGTDAYIKSVGAVANTVTKVADTYADARIKADEQVKKTTIDKLVVEYDSSINKPRRDFEALPLGNDLNDQYLEATKQKDQIKTSILTNTSLPEDYKKELNDELDKRDKIWEGQVYAKLAQGNVAYQAKNSEAKLKMYQKDAVLSATKIDPKNPDSFKLFDGVLVEIEDTVKNAAQAMGLSQTDKSGQPVYGEATNNMIAKGKSDTVQSGIESLLAINQVDKAKALYDRYSPELDGLIKPEITGRLNKAVENNQVIKTADKIIKTVPREQQLVEAAKIKDPEQSRLVGDRIRSNQVKQDRIKADTQEALFEPTLAKVDEVMNGPNRFTSISEMRNHPLVAQNWSNLSTAQKNTLESKVKRPDISNYDQIAKMDEILSSGKLLKTIPDRKTFDKETNGMTTKDYGKYLSQWEDAKDPKSKGLTSGTRSNILAKSKELFKSSGLLNTVRGTNKIDPKSMKKWEAFQDELFADFENMDGSQYQPNSKQTQEYVKSKVNDYILKNKKEDKGFFGGLFDKAKSAIQNNKKEAPKSKDQLLQDL